MSNCRYYANGMSFLLPIYDGMSKFLIKSIVFAFVPIGPLIDPLAAFARIEPPQYAFMLFQLLMHSYTAYHGDVRIFGLF